MESRTIARVALFAAVIAVLGMLPNIVVPIALGVPITAQTLGVMLAGILLGPRHGALAVVLFLFAVLLGAPLLSGGRGGLGVFAGPSAGFLLGFVPAAYAAGALMCRLTRLPVFSAALIAAVGGGVLVEYAFGVLGLMIVGRLELFHAIVATAVFLPGDLLKSLAAAFVAAACYRASPATVCGRA